MLLQEPELIPSSHPVRQTFNMTCEDISEWKVLKNTSEVDSTGCYMPTQAICTVLASQLVRPTSTTVSYASKGFTSAMQRLVVAKIRNKSATSDRGRLILAAGLLNVVAICSAGIKLLEQCTRECRTGKTRAGQDRTGQDRTGQDRKHIIGHDKVEGLCKRCASVEYIYPDSERSVGYI